MAWTEILVNSSPKAGVTKYNALDDCKTTVEPQIISVGVSKNPHEQTRPLRVFFFVAPTCAQQLAEIIDSEIRYLVLSENRVLFHHKCYVYSAKVVLLSTAKMETTKSRV